MIEVRDLVKRYGEHIAVDHLSFKVEKGQIYGFLGPNGAGKTTTMNIMTGYIGPSEGEVIINGHNILEEPEEAKRCIGYLPEQPPLYVDMTPREYLNFAAELKGLGPDEAEESVEKVMALTKIEDVQNRLIKNLSKGYRQRVGLAQAILGLPEILILDEPTVGLDPKQILEIRELIRSLANDHTIILSSHILSEVSEVCDHVLIIHHGKLIATGTPEELEQNFRGNTLELVLKSEDMDAVRELIRNIPGVIAVDCRTTKREGEVFAAVEPESGADIREALFNACAGADCPILMMRPSGVSLENIFLTLTADSRTPGAGSAQAVRALTTQEDEKEGD